MVLYIVSSAVCSCFVVRFNIVCGAVLHGLWCALSMLPSDVCKCWKPAGKEISEEGGAFSLTPSSTMLGVLMYGSKCLCYYV